MEWLIKVGQLLLSLSILVLLHEFGHFAAARIFKTRVEKFYLFFDFLFPFPNLAKFAIFKIKIGDTEYGLGWFPLGGYVKIAGMLDESADKEAMSQPPQPWEFRSKPAWQRLIIILGGIIVNVILGILIYSLSLFTWGERYLPTQNATYGIFITDSAAYDMGLRNGDKILTVDNEPVKGFYQVVGRVIIDQAETIQIEREGRKMEIAVTDDFIREAIAKGKRNPMWDVRTPFYIGEFVKGYKAKDFGFEKKDKIVAFNEQPVEYFDAFRDLAQQHRSEDISVTVVRSSDTLKIPAKLDSTGALGIRPAGVEDLAALGYFRLDTVRYGFFESFPAGFRLSFRIISDYAKQFGLMFQPKTGAYKQVGGFGSLASMFPPYWDWEAFWKFTGLLSLVLAFMNFLPIPMLDGGYMLFILYEMITRRKPSDKFMEVANTIGFVIVLALLLYANGNDVLKIFTGG